MISAGILLYRKRLDKVEVFLVHPGGPFWKNKDEGAWTIPKGEVMPGEENFDAAVREFLEETGVQLKGKFKVLNPVRQKAGKLIYAWAIHKNIDERKIKSNMFEMEWPPKSGKTSSFPEIDKGGWFDLDSAAKKINPAMFIYIKVNSRTSCTVKNVNNYAHQRKNADGR